MLCAYAGIMTQDFGNCTARVPANDLSDEGRARIGIHRRKFEERIRTLGCHRREGRLHPSCNPRIVAVTILGSLDRIGKRHKPDGSLQPAQIAEAVVSRLFAGLRRDKAKNNGKRRIRTA